MNILNTISFIALFSLALLSSACTEDRAPVICGNGIIEGGEICDGEALANNSCESEGFIGGTLGCATNCRSLVITGCDQCGNGELNEGEVCDSDIMPEGFSCEEMDYVGGQLLCEECRGIATTDCHNCGNLTVDPGEACDGEDFAGVSCIDDGFPAGQLSCDESCGSYDISGCSLPYFDLCLLYFALQTESQPADDASCYVQSLSPGAELDPVQVELACRSGQPGRIWANQLIDSLNQNKLEIDWPQAKECLAATHNFRSTTGAWQATTESSEWQTLINDSCKDFMHGVQVENDACSHHWECADGLSCYSSSPFVADSSQCMQKSAAGTACHPVFHPCIDGFGCTKNAEAPGFTCLSLKVDGNPCSAHEECDSGYCFDGSEPNICMVKPALLAAGEECSLATECAGECTTCRVLVLDDPKVCATQALLGDYCQTSNDCMDGAGCVENICAQATSGTLCTDDLPCPRGFSCIEECALQTSMGDCVATGGCLWASNICTSEDQSRHCVPHPQTGEECYDVSECASGYCDAGSCKDWALEDDPCADTLCHPAYECYNGLCTFPCEFKEDCQDGNYCEKESVTIAACRPIVEDTCSSFDACPNGQYCKIATAFPGVCSVKEVIGAACDPAAKNSAGLSLVCASGWCSEKEDASFACSVEQATQTTFGIQTILDGFLSGFTP